MESSFGEFLGLKLSTVEGEEALEKETSRTLLRLIINAKDERRDK